MNGMLMESLMGFLWGFALVLWGHDLRFTPEITNSFSIYCVSGGIGTVTLSSLP